MTQNQVEGGGGLSNSLYHFLKKTFPSAGPEVDSFEVL